MASAICEAWPDADVAEDRTPDLMAALEQSIADAKAARARREQQR